MDSLATETIRSDDSIHKSSRSKRHKIEKTEKIDAEPADTTIDEAGVAHLLEKIDTLTREIEGGQNFCRFALNRLPNDETWEQPRRDILEVTKQTLATSFKVVVLGASGVGKSSVLNVLLDEGNLLPSSATGGACTAVPIEIHYNNDPESLDVKAEIQYMTEIEWRVVVEQARAEIDTDEDDRTDEGHGAVQRVRLVYPDLSEIDLVENEVDDIMATNDSRTLLGECNTLEASNRVDFYQEFKQSIGSLKSAGFAAWPMIDHVRLYIRHPLLENGLVLVDIPGMFETNQARVENAANYLEKCSAVCVMTHAARSKSDASQRSLVNRALQQMQFDQHLNNVLFVCTKSDEMNLRETLNELDIPESKPLESEDKRAKQDRARLSNEYKTFDLQLQDTEAAIKLSEKEIGRWKRAKSKIAGNWDSFKPPRDRLDNGKFVKAEPTGQLWGEDEVDEIMEKLKEERTTARSRSKQLKAQLESKKRQLKTIDDTIEDIDTKLRRAIFQARNNLIKEKQAQHYLSTIKMYERNSARAAAGIVESADDGATQVEGFDKVKGKVFCVSALAYSRLAKLKIYDINAGAETVKDNGNSTNFLKNKEDTDVPALGRRLKYMALTKQYQDLRKIQLKLQLALSSLQGRLSPNIQKKEIDVQAAICAAQSFTNNVSQFIQGFGKSLATDVAIQDVYKKLFTDLIPRVKTLAIKKAIQKIEPYSRHPGDSGRSHLGLYPAEYKAAVHPTRNGFYNTNRECEDGTKLVVNFNEVLASVIRLFTHKAVQKVLVSDRHGIKPVFLEIEGKLEIVLDKLHDNFRLKATIAGVNLRRIVLMDEKLLLRKRELQQVFLDVAQAINEAHVTAAAPRVLEKDIKTQWMPGYARAYQQFGTGARKAMSDELAGALDKDNVVEHALNMMDRRIHANLNQILTDLATKLTNMTNSIIADYESCMKQRSQVIESTGDPKLDEVRSEMISLGFEDLKLHDDEEEDGKVGEIAFEIGLGASDPEAVRVGLMNELNEDDGDGDETSDEAVIKMEVDAGKEDGEVTDPEMAMVLYQMD